MLKKGNIVLIPFPFSDLSAQKVRPAVIISDINKGDDVVVAFISSKKPKRKELTDVLISDGSVGFTETGLKVSSVVRVSKIATLDKKIILGKLGEFSKAIEKEIALKIKLLFGL